MHKHRGTGSARRLAAEATRGLAKVVAGATGARRDQGGGPTLLSTGTVAEVDPWSAQPPPAKLRARPRS